MVTDEQKKSSLIQNIFNRVGNPLEWSFVNKVLALFFMPSVFMP